MIQFKDITLEDRETIISYTQNSDRRNCDLSFSNLCSWRFLYDTQFAIVENFLVLKFYHTNGKLAYMMPVGTGDLKPVLDKMIEDARAEERQFRMYGVCSSMEEELEGIMPGKLKFSCNRNYADYIYLREDLATLAGKKFQSKRNHVNKFIKNYNYEYAPITPDTVAECLALEREWCRANNCDEREDLVNEYKSLKFALDHFEEIGLTGGLLRVDGKIVAFTFGMPIGIDTFGVHVEKANTDIEGAYAMINQQFAQHVPEQYIYLNREEDLGLEGLRKAKLSYQPAILLEKGMVTLIED
jgi:Uncharacterized conserved protein